MIKTCFGTKLLRPPLQLKPNVNNHMGVQRMQGFGLLLTRFTSEGLLVAKVCFSSGNFLSRSFFSALALTLASWSVARIRDESESIIKMSKQVKHMCDITFTNKSSYSMHGREPLRLRLSAFIFSSFSTCLSAPRNLPIKLLLLQKVSFNE